MQRGSHAVRDARRRCLAVRPGGRRRTGGRASRRSGGPRRRPAVDRHPRDCAALAERYGVPHCTRAPRGASPALAARPVVLADRRWWRGGVLAAGAPRPAGRRVGRDRAHFLAPGDRVGLHPFARIGPPTALPGSTPEHLLPGHGDRPSRGTSWARSSRRRDPPRPPRSPPRLDRRRPLLEALTGCDAGVWDGPRGVVVGSTGIRSRNRKIAGGAAGGAGARWEDRRDGPVPSSWAPTAATLRVTDPDERHGADPGAAAHHVRARQSKALVPDDPAAAPATTLTLDLATNGTPIRLPPVRAVRVGSTAAGDATLRVGHATTRRCSPRSRRWCGSARTPRR